jgi:hypothetical protein
MRRGGASSAVVGPHRVARAVQGDLAAVREDPLRPCVPKRYADAYHGLRVVTRNCFDRDVTLGGTMGGSVVERGSGSVEVGGRRPSDEHGVHRGKHAAFTEGPQDPTELTGRNEFLAGLEEQHPTGQHGRIGVEATGGQNPLDDLDAASPRWPGHNPWRPGPGP